MTKYCALVVFLGSLLISCDQSGSTETIAAGSDQIPAGAILKSYNEVPGLVRATVKDVGFKIEEGDLLDKLRHGSWVTYDKSGAVQSLTTYYKGKKQGVSLVFDRNGYIETLTNYVDGQLNGDYKAYNRKRVSEERTYVDGKLDGVVKKYYLNGTVMEEAPYVNGKMHGIAKWFNEEGDLSLAYEYDNGELVDKNPKVEE